MSLTLLIQASSGTPALALGRAGETLFDSSTDPAQANSRDYRALLETGFNATGTTLSDLTALACDIGPGGLGVTRTAAAFVNALGFALALPVHGLPAFEMLGAEVETAPRPVALLRRAGRPYVHFGLFHDGKLTHYEHCLEEEALKQIENLTDYDLAGNIPVGDQPPVTNHATMATMLRLVKERSPDANARAWPIVEALT